MLKSRYYHTSHWKTGSCNAFDVIVLFAVLCRCIGWVGNICGSVSPNLNNNIKSSSMLITREPFVIPTRWDWIGLLIIIGVFGFLAQVRAGQILTHTYTYLLERYY